MMETDLRRKIERLHGPILVLGASGFIGSNLFRMLLKVRKDVYGSASRLPAWRLEGIPDDNVVETDLIVSSNLTLLLDRIKPQTVLDCISYGAYPFEKEVELIYRTNLNFAVRLLEELHTRQVQMYVHAGSSSEYGDHASAPLETDAFMPNSHYSVSKGAIAGAIYYTGKKLSLPCANLRFYSVYGPFEDASRLIPSIVLQGVGGGLPSFVDPNVSRDFVYVEDACEAFVDTALHLKEPYYGDSFNIGTGRCLTIGEVAEISRSFFGIDEKPIYSMPLRHWDVCDWYAAPGKVESVLGWKAKIPFEDGLRKTTEWLRRLDNIDTYQKSSKKYGLNTRYSISAIVACYRDEPAIPIMYERLTTVFTQLGIDYEIIFVNDCSPDKSEEVIRAISSHDRRVLGVSHSRNFGSQSAFRSGMEVASKNACVLLDGDLQDPPEVIGSFFQKWMQGFDVVYGHRIKRDAPWYMQFAYKAFYRIFDTFSYIKIPRDAGDFSLIDKRVVRCLLQFPERDLFLRGVRAFAGFKQVGVDYHRPKRLFGKTTNSLFKNLGWAKKGILSFSNAPLNALSSVSFFLAGVTFVLALFQTIAKLLFPSLAPAGLTTVLIGIMFFGSINLLAVSLIGEYIAKIFEEVKRRPHFLRRSIIRDGEIRNAADETLQINQQRGSD